MKAAGNRNMPGIRTAGKWEVEEESIALCASSLTFHPVTKKEMTFEIEPVGGAFPVVSSLILVGLFSAAGCDIGNCGGEDLWIQRSRACK